jgi:RHS repeat-associated protein
MTTATGIISWQAQTSAFGDTKIDMQIASTRLAAENNHRFPGQYYDAETGLHQNYFRDYEASIGRYVQRDPIGLRGGINVYLYANASPIIFSDPWGLKCWKQSNGTKACDTWKDHGANDSWSDGGANSSGIPPKDPSIELPSGTMVLCMFNCIMKTAVPNSVLVGCCLGKGKFKGSPIPPPARTVCCVAAAAMAATALTICYLKCKCESE